MIEVEDLIKNLSTNELVAKGILVPGEFGLEFIHIKEPSSGFLFRLAVLPIINNF